MFFIFVICTIIFPTLAYYGYKYNRKSHQINRVINQVISWSLYILSFFVLMADVIDVINIFFLTTNGMNER